MAINFGTTSTLHPTLPSLISLKILKHKNLLNPPSPSPSPASLKVYAFSDGTESRFTNDDDSPAYSAFGPSPSSARTQLDLLEQLTSGRSSADGYESDGSSCRSTIREQLVNLVGDRDDDFSIPLGKKLKKVKPLTISQKRNIRRQTYLTEVSGRNDSTFFATIGAFVLLPPLIILGIAVATGYVQLLP